MKVRNGHSGFIDMFEDCVANDAIKGIERQRLDVADIINDIGVSVEKIDVGGCNLVGTK